MGQHHAVSVTATPMNGDLSAVLLALVCAAGLILGLNYLVVRRRSATRAATATPQEPAVVRYARSLFPVLLIVLLFRAFAFEPFRIPSESMMPGLVPGDFILVEKFSYGLRVPQLNWKIVPTGEPQRGDVVVFRAPSEPIILIKRLVGLPGDHVVVRDNQVTVNGVAVRRVSEGIYTDGNEFSGAPLEREWFGKTEHLIMLSGNQISVDFDGVVPPGHFFFMGDNRNDSEDSRFSKVGFVADDRLLGRAVRIWMNWRIPGWPRFVRIGKRIE